MGFPMMTPYLLIVAITSPFTPVLATSGVSAAISRPGRTGWRLEGKVLPFDGTTPYPECSRRNALSLPLRRARGVAIPSTILPAPRRLLALLRGDAFPPATGL